MPFSATVVVSYQPVGIFITGKIAGAVNSTHKQSSYRIGRLMRLHVDDLNVSNAAAAFMRTLADRRRYAAKVYTQRLLMVRPHLDVIRSHSAAFVFSA
jgi:hypothetical protein